MQGESEGQDERGTPSVEFRGDIGGSQTQKIVF